MNVFFAGTGGFGAPSLEALTQLDPPCSVAKVLTRSDRPKGRGRKLYPTPIKETALKLGLEVATVDTVSALREEVVSTPPDLLVVIDFGMLLPEDVFTAPRCGAYNFHASLLPRWRGAAPCPRAILAGDVRTGVACFQIVKALDAGPIAGMREVAIESDETAGALEERLSRESALLLQHLVPDILAGACPLLPQDPTQVTTAPKLAKSEGRIDWNQGAEMLSRHVRAMQPWPKSFSFLHARNRPPVRVTILGFRPVDSEKTPADGAEPGTITQVTRSAVFVACGEGTTGAIETIQPAGKRPMSCEDFLRGHGLVAGDFFADA